eukprot:537578-Hanusia_phi.AAC.1
MAQLGDARGGGGGGDVGSNANIASVLMSFHSRSPAILPSLLACDLAKLADEANRVSPTSDDYVHERAGARGRADMAEAGANMFTFHIEVMKDEQETRNLIQAIKAANMKCGIAVKPKTAVSAVFPFVEELDLVLVMTVEPGFGSLVAMGWQWCDLLSRRTIFHGRHDAQGEGAEVLPPSDSRALLTSLTERSSPTSTWRWTEESGPAT